MALHSDSQEIPQQLQAQSNKAKSNVYVTVQFGHNDQKPNDTYKPTFLANLKRMANDVVTAGGHPILVTPLSRRNYFKNGTIEDILEPWAIYVRQAAATTNQPFIELLQTSITYLNKIGKAAAMKLNYEEKDYTHLNENGKVIFGRMVADLIKAKNIISPSPFVVDAALSEQEAAGIPSF
ncbi:SGNH hydrolase-type esterase domain-containing protein [Rhexocercosporidium sp. MPI-PUGE-AT-0058]|nr:SGNH hydrolase-type esterase domain-containing protein [Rhexocercosporidium sp. MPI-PUGE-AT-0058]